MKPSNGVCHLQKLNSLLVGLYTVKCSITGLPVGVDRGTDMWVSNWPGFPLVVFVLLQAANDKKNSPVAAMIPYFLM